MIDATYWNGEPCEARRVRVILGDSDRFPRYWAREEGLIGREVDAVEVTYNGGTFYLYDEPACTDPECDCGGIGPGWAKVTHGRGSPRYGHRGLENVQVVE